MVSVDITRLDPQAPGGCEELNRLLTGRGELKFNPVVGSSGIIYPTLYTCQIWPNVSVKICNCELWSRSKRSDGHALLDTRHPCFTAWRNAKQQ